MKLKVAVLGCMDYEEALKLQERLLELRSRSEFQNTLLLLEHPPVLTLGRRGVASNILASSGELERYGAKIYEVSRGGDVTYHGPGQIVGYSIVSLDDFGRDIKDFVWKLEEVFIQILEKEYGIKARRDEKKYTGVWVGDEKITAIGIAVKRWITMHGFAFNVNTQLEHFRWIVPCGLPDRGVTSLEKITGGLIDMQKAYRQVAAYFCEVFGLELEFIGREALLALAGGEPHGDR